MNNESTYRIPRVAAPPVLDASWGKPFWSAIPAASITRFMGDEPPHKPHTEFKLAHDGTNLYVIFRVSDQFVLSTNRVPQSAVCQDSCVEFFFTPRGQTAEDYFNLEINCGGTPLFHYQTARRKGVPLGAADVAAVRIATSMPPVVSPEISTPTTWVVEYSLPLEIPARVAGVPLPGSGNRWRANFYKCADNSSHPHWLTWAPVAIPYPDFHRPEFFGIMEFE